MPEAPVRISKNGLVVDGEGWFVINARDSRWKDEGPLGSYCNFEGKRRFPHFGINISVLEPGERMGMYHRENGQEAFLVLGGECTLIVEGRERQLVAWDFFHCAPGTEHIIVAAGQQSAIVLAVGARGRAVGGGVVYTICKAAARYGAKRYPRNIRSGGRLREGLGSASAVPIRQVPAGLASRNRLAVAYRVADPHRPRTNAGRASSDRCAGPVTAMPTGCLPSRTVIL